MDGLNLATGNILMLSEGRVGIDNVYTLKEGGCSQYSLIFEIAPLNLSLNRTIDATS